jgi:hypothetical protein
VRQTAAMAVLALKKAKNRVLLSALGVLEQDCGCIWGVGSGFESSLAHACQLGPCGALRQKSYFLGEWGCACAARGCSTTGSDRRSLCEDDLTLIVEAVKKAIFITKNACFRPLWVFQQANFIRDFTALYFFVFNRFFVIQAPFLNKTLNRLCWWFSHRA